MTSLSVRPRSRWAFLAPFTVLPILPVIVIGLLPGSSNASRPLSPPVPFEVTSLAPQPLVLPVEVREFVTVSLYNVNRRETGTFVLPLDGRLEPEQAKTFGFFFRDRRTGRHGPMAETTVAILADLAKTFPGQTIEIVSGWRAPPNGAPHSKHFRGRAIDLRIPGVKTAYVRDHLWLKHRHVGVGYYPHQNFVHVDTRPEERDTAWISRREGAPNRYHPRWARRLLPKTIY
jgi:uncharacterized protein YcbK (DUF882 family)